MTPRKIDVGEIQSTIDATKALMDQFDPEDREEMQALADVVTSHLLRSGLIGRPKEEEAAVSLDEAVRALRGKKTRRMLLQIKVFVAALSGYDEPGEVLMNDAEEFLNEFGPALIADLTEAKQKWSND